jgi:hypothetical protein
MADQRLFSAENLSKTLLQVVGEPSGVLATIGGVDVNLVPISADELFSSLDILLRLADLADGAQSGKLDGPSIMRVIGTDGARVGQLLKSIVRRSLVSAGALDPNVDAEVRGFDAWFGSLPIVESAKTLLPKVLAANGVSDLARPQNPVTEQPAPESSTQPTPSS